MTATFSTDGTKVDLTTGGNLMKGTYAVNATAGVTGSASVAVDDRKVGKIQILSTKMIQGATTKTATVPYKVFDQYGTEITKNALANNITWTSSLGTALDNNNGTVTITNSIDFTNTDNAILTGIDGTSGVSASSNEAFAKAPSISSITFGTPVLPTGKTTVQTGQGTAVSIPVTVKDEFGNVINDTAELDSSILLTILSDGAYSYSTDADNNVLLNLDTTAISDAKVVTANLIEKATGKSYSTTVNVVKPSGPDAVAIGSFSDTVAVGDDTINIPLTVTDQFGNAISADDVAADVATPGVITVTSSNSSVIGTNDLVIAQGGSHKGNIVFASGKSVLAKGTTTVTVYVNATGKSTSLTISTVDARVPATVKLDPAFKTTMIQGSTNSFAVTLYDQYGTQMKSGDAATTAADSNSYYVKLGLVKQSGDTNAVTIATGSGNITPTNSLNYVSYPFKLAADAGLTGSYKLEVVLYDASNNNLSEVDKTISVVKNNVTGLTYNVTDIPTIAGNATHTAASTDPQARQIKVTAKDASGVSYSVPASAIYKVTTSDSSVAAVSATADGSNKWWVAGADISAGTDATKTATITVYVATDNGTQTFSKQVTVSKAAPAAQSIVLVDKATTDNWTLDPAAKTITDLSYAARTNASTGSTLYAYGLDQYGVYTKLSDTAFTVADTKKVNTINGVTYGTTDGFIFDSTNNLFKLAEGTPLDVNYDANTPLYLTLFQGNAAATLKVTIASEELPTVATPISSGNTTGIAAAAGTANIVFSEELNASGIAAVEAALNAKVTGAAASDLAYTWTAATKTLTVQNNNATLAAKFGTANVTATITDLAGNATSGAILVTP